MRSGASAAPAVGIRQSTREPRPAGTASRLVGLQTPPSTYSRPPISHRREDPRHGATRQHRLRDRRARGVGRAEDHAPAAGAVDGEDPQAAVEASRRARRGDRAGRRACAPAAARGSAPRRARAVPRARSWPARAGRTASRPPCRSAPRRGRRRRAGWSARGRPAHRRVRAAPRRAPTPAPPARPPRAACRRRASRRRSSPPRSRAGTRSRGSPAPRPPRGRRGRRAATPRRACRPRRARARRAGRGSRRSPRHRLARKLTRRSETCSAFDRGLAEGTKLSRVHRREIGGPDNRSEQLGGNLGAT